MVDGPKPRSTYSRPGRRSRADKELQFLPISARIEMQEVGREIGWLWLVASCPQRERRDCLHVDVQIFARWRRPEFCRVRVVADPGVDSPIVDLVDFG